MSGPHSATISIVAPAFNEEACIGSVVREWLGVFDQHRIDGEIVVANDGSTDRTGEVLRDLERLDERVRHVHLPANGGYGRALAAAIAASTGEWIATIDSDGQFAGSDVPRLHAFAVEHGYELVTGYRRAKIDTPLRVAADRGLRFVVRGMFGLRVRDSNCALKLARADWLRGIQIEATGFPTPTEIMVKAHRSGLRVGELDVEHRARQAGQSKLSIVRTAASSLVFLVGLRLRASR